MREELARLFSIRADSPYLEEALIHPSHANELKLDRNNQRLEFLGDAVLELCVSELLCERFPAAAEGDLTRMRAQLVNTEALAAWGRARGVSEALLVGRGAEASGLRHSTGVLADAVEALIAATYLEGGLQAARAACARIVEPSLAALQRGPQLDAKTALQEQVQAEGLSAPTYKTVESWGPAHERWFRVEVYLDGAALAQGLGRSKRAAEQAAAQEALDVRGKVDADDRSESATEPVVTGSSEET